jgi:hypothetical protein
LRNYFGDDWFRAAEADAALRRAMERRRESGAESGDGALHVGATLAAACQRIGIPVDQLVAMAGDETSQTDPLLADPEIREEIRRAQERKLREEKEATILEAAEQKFGARKDYAKTLGTWARGIQNKFVGGLILRRQDNIQKSTN